jgi:uncharacterized membrane protein
VVGGDGLGGPLNPVRLLETDGGSPVPRTLRGTTGEQAAARKVLVGGVALAGLALAALATLFAVDPHLFARVAAVLGATFAGGRMTGILTGLELGLGTLATAVTIICLNSCWLLIAVPLFEMATGRIDPRRLLGPIFRGAERRARSQTRRMRNLGAAGLVLFIWLPFPLTGAFVGALIGLLMGISLVRLVPLVLASMWIGVLTWTWGFRTLFVFTGSAGHAAAWIITGCFLVYSVVVRARESEGVRTE